MDGGCESCVKDKHHVSETDIWITRKRFATLGPFQQRQWVLDYLHTNTSTEDRETIFIVSGKSVCLNVWLRILGLSRSRYYEVRRLFNRGAIRIERLVSPKSHQNKSYEAIAWMEFYFNQVGDHLPDRMAIHLPSFLTNSLVFNRMNEDFTARRLPVISQSHFYKLWATEFPHVTIPKVKI